MEAVAPFIHLLGEIGQLGQIGVFIVLIGIYTQLRALKERFDQLAAKVEVHASTIGRLEVAIAHLQGWLDRESPKP